MAPGERRQDMLDFGIKVGVLENNVDLLTKIVTKMDGTLEKTQDVAVNLAKIVAVHEERMGFHDKSLDTHKSDDNDKFDKLTDLVEEVKTELGKKIDSVQKQLEPIKKFVYMTMGAVAIFMAFLEIVNHLLK